LPKPKKQRTMIFNDDIYRFGWMVCVRGSLQEAIDRFAKKIGIEPWQAKDAYSRRNGHFCADRDHKSGLLWFPTKTPAASVVAHECFHATMFVMNFLDIEKVGENEEEVFAYYMEWLIAKIMGDRIE